MYKDPHNRIANLPRGIPSRKTNTFWMILFIPSLPLLGFVVCVMLYAVGEVLFHSIFG